MSNRKRPEIHAKSGLCVQRRSARGAIRGRHVVVTGGGVGIGKAIAERLAAEGATLSVLARDLERLGSWPATSVPGAALRHPRPGRGRRGVRRRRGRDLGPIHALVAVSGIGGPNEDGPDDRFDDLVQTNLSGTYYTVRAALRHLADGPEARHVVVISSILARIAVPGYTGYSASKAGLLGLVRSLAAELAPRNVQVNAICPGWVDTDMAWQGLDGIAEAIGGTRDDAYREAMREVPLGTDETASGHRGDGGVAALAGRPRRHRPGDRPERRRLDGVSGSPGTGAPDRKRSARGRSSSGSGLSQAGGADGAGAVRPASIRSSSSSVPCRTGPLNQFFAERNHQPPKMMPMPANHSTV